MQTLEGEVIKAIFGEGSASEHMAIWLEVNKDVLENPDDFLDRYKLRRQGGNAFQDPVLDALEGQYIKATGTIHNYLFIIQPDAYEIIERD